MGTSCRWFTGNSAHRCWLLQLDFPPALTNMQSSLQYLVHLNLSDRATTVDTVSEHLTTAGAAVTSYIPDDTLLVVAQPAQVQAIKQVEGVHLVLPHIKAQHIGDAYLQCTNTHRP